MTQKEKLSRMDSEIVRLLGRAIDTAITYGDEINFVTKNGKLAYPYQEKIDFDAEKQLSRSKCLSHATDYAFNLPLNMVPELASCRLEDMSVLDLTVSVKTPEGNRDFTLVREEFSLPSVVINTNIFDNDIMGYLFFRENFSDSLLKSDIEDLDRGQLATVLSPYLSSELAHKIFVEFKETVIKKGFFKQEYALSFAFAMSERELFDKIYEDVNPWECRNAKLPSEMDSCANIGGYWFYWPCNTIH